MGLPVSSFGATVSTLAGAATSGDAAVTLLTLSGSYSQITILNEGTVAGFVSVDGWLNAIKLPAGATGAPASITISAAVPGGIPSGTMTVAMRRATGGTDLTGVSAFAF